MDALHTMQCEPCQAGAPTVSEQELTELISQLPGWEIITVDSILQLRRIFSFRNFRQAQAFANDVGTLAEQHGHHPAILIEWGKTTVTWWTHSIRGLHKTDFIMAAKTDLLLPAE